MLNYSNGVLFSVKQRNSPVSYAAWLLATVKQRCFAHYTHVALLYNDVVYECSIHGVCITLHDYASAVYDVFLPLTELSMSPISTVDAAIDTATECNPRLCTRLVTDVLTMLGSDLTGVVTPDELYAWLTVYEIGGGGDGKWLT